MKVTICQINPQADALDACLEDLAAHAIAHNTDFLLLPEMCFSPWLAASDAPDADDWRAAVAAHDHYIDRLADFGARAIMGTRPTVNAQGSRRNQAFMWTAETGAAPVHEKYYLPDEEGYWENTWYDRGARQFDTARALDARLGVQICTELWFFDWARHYARERVDILCAPRATPHETTAKWRIGVQAAAICSGAYCLSSNLWAPMGAPSASEDSPNLGGVGFIADPDGMILAETNPEAPIASINIDLNRARTAKATYPRYVPE